MGELGKKFADTEKPSCSIAYAGIDQKAEPVFDTAAELSASEGAQHYFSRNRCRYPADD